MPQPILVTPSLTLKALVERWRHARVGERAQMQSYLIELGQALGVEPQRPAGSGYGFEYAVRVVKRDGSATTSLLDLDDRGHFALEAKEYGAGTPTGLLLRHAVDQVRSYVGHLLDERLPYRLVVQLLGRVDAAWYHVAARLRPAA